MSLASLACIKDGGGPQVAVASPSPQEQLSDHY